MDPEPCQENFFVICLNLFDFFLGPGFCKVDFLALWKFLLCCSVLRSLCFFFSSWLSQRLCEQRPHTQAPMSCTALPCQHWDPGQCPYLKMKIQTCTKVKGSLWSYLKVNVMTIFRTSLLILHLTVLENRILKLLNELLKWESSIFWNRLWLVLIAVSPFRWPEVSPDVSCHN